VNSVVTGSRRPSALIDRARDGTRTAMWISLAISMLAHFAIGAARSLFTGRSVWASGRDMFLVGFGVAAVGYVIGELITRVL
jgi:VIT1/CCC1 family predicted Fe2+/Mn2+ transporter